MAFEDTNKLLSGPRAGIASFKNIGDSVTGVLVNAEVAPETTPQGVEVIDQRTGKVKQQIIYTLKTDLRDPSDEDDEGLRRVFAKWAIQRAISEALAEAGLTKVGLQEGGTLTVTHTATKKSETRGFSDAKLYSAVYVAPPAAKLPSSTAPVEEAESGSYSTQQVDLAHQIKTNNPEASFTAISAATQIAVEDLAGILGVF